MASDNQTVKLTNVRLLFPVLFEAEAFKKEPGKEKKYSARFGLLKADTAQTAAIAAAILETARAKWGPKAESTLKALKAENRICCTDGDLKDTEGFAGHHIISANRKEKDGRPLLLDASRTKLLENNGKLYSGCYVNAILRFWAQGEESGWGKRINAQIQGIQFFKDGEAFSGGGTASVDQFDAVEAPADATLDSLGF